MLGLGESEAETLQTMRDLRSNKNVDLLSVNIFILCNNLKGFKIF